MLVPPGSTALRPRLHRLALPPSDHSCNVWSHRTKAAGAAASTDTKCQSNRFAADRLVPNSSSISHEAAIISCFVLVTNVGEEYKLKASDLTFSHQHSYESLLGRDATYLADYTASNSRRQHLQERSS